jgi:hypothetical protein
LKSSSFSINYVLFDKHYEKLIVLAATTTTETTSTSVTATSKIEDYETYV